MRILIATGLSIGLLSIALTGFARSAYYAPYETSTNQPAKAVAVAEQFAGSYREGHTRFPQSIRPTGYRVFIFSPRHKLWAAYNSGGQRVGYGRANGGAAYCNDINRACKTPRGKFRVYSKGTYACKSSKFPVGVGGAPMPYCMYFRGGYAIHGSPYISDVNGSHGCIRVTTTAAAWLHQNFMRHGTRVLVLSY